MAVNMESSKLNGYEKYPGSSSDTATGIPVNSSDQYYIANPAPIKPRAKVPWSTGLFDCFSDCRNCCMTFWCPCVTFGQIAEIVDKGSSSCGVTGALYVLIGLVTGCSCLYSCFYRSKMRQQYALHESPCNDCLLHCCCEYCALCQEYRELKSRGFDMKLGWHGNMEKQNQGVAMAPVVEEGMSRKGEE